LANSHINSKEFDKAELILKKSLQICMSYTPPKYYLPQSELEVYIEENLPREVRGKYLIWTLVSLTEIYIVQKKPQLALENLSKIVLISTRINAANSPVHLNNLNHVAEFYYRLRDFDSARTLWINVLSTIKKDFPAVHTTFVKFSASANLGLGLIELDKGNWEKAVDFLELSWKQHRLHKGVDSLATLKVIKALAQAYTKLEKYEKARTLVEFVGSIYTKLKYEDPLPELIELHKKILPHTKNPDKPPTLPRPTRNGLLTEEEQKQLQEE